MCCQVESRCRSQGETLRFLVSTCAEEECLIFCSNCEICHMDPHENHVRRRQEASLTVSDVHFHCLSVVSSRITTFGEASAFMQKSQAQQPIPNFWLPENFRTIILVSRRRSGWAQKFCMELFFQNFSSYFTICGDGRRKKKNWIFHKSRAGRRKSFFFRRDVESARPQRPRGVSLDSVGERQILALGRGVLSILSRRFGHEPRRLVTEPCKQMWWNALNRLKTLKKAEKHFSARR